METTVTHAEAMRIRRFLDFLANRGRKPKTLSTHAASHRAVALAIGRIMGAPFDLECVMGSHVQLWRDQQLSEGRSVATINTRLTFLQSYTAWVLQHQELDPDRAAGINAIHRIPEQPLAPRGLDLDSLRMLASHVDSCGGARERAIFALLLHGCRLGEVAGLTVAAAKTAAATGELIIRGGHVKHSRVRTVPIGSDAQRRLQEYLTIRGDTPGRLFVGQRGPLGEHGIYRIVRQLGANLGLRLSPHQLRHAFAQRFLASSGNDLVALQALLGHASVSTTGRYGRKNYNQLKKMIQDLAAM